MALGLGEGDQGRNVGEFEIQDVRPGTRKCEIRAVGTRHWQNGYKKAGKWVGWSLAEEYNFQKRRQIKFINSLS